MNTAEEQSSQCRIGRANIEYWIIYKLHFVCRLSILIIIWFFSWHLLICHLVSSSFSLSLSIRHISSNRLISQRWEVCSFRKFNFKAFGFCFCSSHYRTLRQCIWLDYLHRVLFRRIVRKWRRRNIFHLFAGEYWL